MPSSAAATPPATCSPRVWYPTPKLRPKFLSENVLVSVLLALAAAISAIFLAEIAFSSGVSIFGPALKDSSLLSSSSILSVNSLISADLSILSKPKNPGFCSDCNLEILQAKPAISPLCFDIVSFLKISIIVGVDT